MKRDAWCVFRLLSVVYQESTCEDYKTKTQTNYLTTQLSNHLTTKLIALFATSALVALALIALPTPRANGQAGGQGTIEGQIVNGTKDAPAASASSVTVTLYMASPGMTAPISQTTKSDASSHFTFSNLDTISTTRYIAMANYGGLEYFSDMLAFPDNTTTLPAFIVVFETTTDPSVIRVDQMHLVLDVESGLFNVLQIIALENTSDHVYIGAPLAGPHRATLILPTLAGARDIQFNNPDADTTTLRGDSVLTYTLPLGPGEDQIVYGYTLPYTPPTYQFNLKLPFDTARLGVLFADVGATFQSAQLGAPTPFPTQSGQNFLLSSADNLTAGTVVKATFANLPATAAAPAPSPSAPTALGGNSQLVGGIVLGVAGLVIVALLAYPLMKRRAAATALQNRRQELLQEIADLDDAFEAKEISEQEYNEERAALKAELVELGDA